MLCCIGNGYHCSGGNCCLHCQGISDGSWDQGRLFRKGGGIRPVEQEDWPVITKE